MKVSDIVEQFNLKVLSGKSGLAREVKGGYVSDLLSDVMGNSKEGQLWVTLQTHKNVMAIASLKDLAAVILVKGFNPNEDTAKQSELEGVPILGTTENTFEITGKIFQYLKENEIIQG
ncbi:MAG: DRTGG domain-containing protein [Bacteroidales bacterium]|jgi:predicted transcriptional regulator|nr:DRTGG domain-containing protein [Bacteroidales bacterium]